MSADKLDMQEWNDLKPEKGNALYHRYIDKASRHTIEVLNKKGVLSIVELKDGLAVSSNSYVGKINIGTLRINIHPKIKGIPLYRLLKYAYGLRDLHIFDEATHNIDSFPFYDLIIYQLYAEIEDLAYRGLNKKYLKLKGDLESPRGKIDINKLATRTITDATLPCTYFERSENNELNRVLLAGIHLSLGLTEDPGLRINLHRLRKSMEESIGTIELNRAILIKTIKGVDRLSERYKPALELINILFESRGIQLEDGSTYLKLNGFFFNMNMFFQSLLSKLMKEYLKGFTIRDEYALHELFAYTPGFNPRNIQAPKPRPDFAIMRGKEVICLLDAKYRDLWEKRLPREMLYQLSIYALSGIGNSTAKIMYPSISPAAKLQKIDIKKPTNGIKQAEVMLQPVSLPIVAELIDFTGKEKTKAEEYIKQVVFSS